jgi:hypothetical protein
LNDAGFRQFGRPETTVRSGINTELLDAVLEAEQHIHAAKNYLYGGDIYSARERMIKVSRANIKFSNAIIQMLTKEEDGK